jgi:serine/threonine-protein kinase
MAMDGNEQDLSRFIGRELGSVTIVKELGRGAMGAVFVAIQRTLKRKVAVKILPKGSGMKGISSEQFRHEAESVAVLSHPNILPIFEMGEEEDCRYQIIQLVEGNDLETILNNRARNPVPSQRTMPVAECIDIVVQVLDGLEHAHRENVVHQDIKPSNILIEAASKRPLIADFGIAKSLEGEITEDGIVYGSPLYMAPERLSGGSSDHRVDIYAVGIMLYKMITGRLPLTESNMMKLLFRKKDGYGAVFTCLPSAASPRIDRSLERILLRAIATNPDERYQFCRVLSQDLQKYRRRIH